MAGAAGGCSRAAAFGSSRVLALKGTNGIIIWSRDDLGWLMRYRALALRQCVSSVLLGAASVVHAAGQHYEGYAYDIDEGKLLYRESHWLYTEDNIERHLIVYRCANGDPFARKHINAAAGAVTPDFDMLDARSGLREGVRTREGHREIFEQANAKATEHHAPLTIPQNAVIDAGLDAFVRTHWNALSDTGVSPVPLLVASRLGYMDFSAHKLRDARADPDDIRWFRLTLASWSFLGAALPHIEIAYDAVTHERREYRGYVDIRGDDNKNLKVRIEFPPSERHTDVALADVARADQTPLTGRCSLH